MGKVRRLDVLLLIKTMLLNGGFVEGVCEGGFAGVTEGWRDYSGGGGRLVMMGGNGIEVGRKRRLSGWREVVRRRVGMRARGGGRVHG